ncbi:MAG: FecR family protein [Spirochaetes bacterium]|nr:FecR family protein [Spirochaetota bacterium]
MIKFKKLVFIIFIFILLFYFNNKIFSQTNQLNNLKPIAKISYFSGKAKIFKQNEQKEYEINLDLLISSDDIVTTEKESKVEIVLLDKNTTITIFENSKLSLSQILNNNNENTTFLSIFYGKIKLFVSKLTGKEEFVVNTPTGIASVRGTEFEVASSDLGDSIIKVYEGKVQVYDDDEKNSIFVEQNETTIIEFNKKPQKISQQNIKEEHKSIDNFINLRNRYSSEIAKIRIKEIFKILNILNKNTKFLESKVNEIYNNAWFQKIFQLIKEKKELNPQEKGYWSAFRNMLSSINYITYKNIYKIKILVELIKNLLPKANLTQSEINNYYKQLNETIQNIENLFIKLIILNKILN